MINYQGCDLLLFAEVLEDNSKTYRTSKPQKLGALRGVVLPPTKAVTIVNKDGFPIGEYKTETQGYSVQIDTEGLSDDFISYLVGSGESGEGFSLDTGENVKRFFALGCRVLNTDNTHKYMWFQKGVFQLQSRTITTKQGTETTGTSLFFYPFMTVRKFDYNGKNIRSIVIDEKKFARVVTTENWSNVVWTPDNLMNIESPLILPISDTVYIGDTIEIQEPEGTSIEYEVLE